MKIMALETSGASGSVALLENGAELAFLELDADGRSAKTLAPAIQKALSDAGLAPKELDAVAVTIGPGSFTGLRVGVATCKAFAWGIGAKVVGTDTLDAIVAGICASEQISAWGGDAPLVLSVGVDAQRGDAAVRNYEISSTDAGFVWRRLEDAFQVISLREWLGKAASNVLFAGPALSRVKNLSTNYPNARLVEESLWSPTARGVGEVARKRLAEDATGDDLWALLPIYSRRAAAEEKRLERERLERETQSGDALKS